jgi:ATP-dependent DNA helicase DinG
MGLCADVERAFSIHGALAKTTPDFCVRPGQSRMAQAVAETLEQGGQLVVEAGTGVGKTFAYLVPVLLSGQRALVSTATKALQDQLAVRDIPRLQQMLGVQARVAVLKGRSSYLCLNRLASARQDPASTTTSSQNELTQIERWALRTESGDLAEVLDLSDQSPIEPLVTSTRDNCLGSVCPQASQCFVNKARAAALASEIVVVNHHLFFADLNVRESGVAELLPNMDIVVFDEAHQLNDTGVHFLARQVSTRQLDDLVRELLKHSSVLALGAVGWRDWVATVTQVSAEMKAMAACTGSEQVVMWGAKAPKGFSEVDWATLTVRLMEALTNLSALLANLAGTSPDVARLELRAARYLKEFAVQLWPGAPGDIRWLECGQHIKLRTSPLDISACMRIHMLVDAFSERRKSWIFTSATLGIGADLSLFCADCGIDSAQVLQVESPFNYASQAVLYVPDSFPQPSDPLHSIEVANLAAQAAIVLGGRTLVLTTSVRAMQVIGTSLRTHFSVAHGLSVLVQGQASKREILERFCQAGNVDNQGIVIVATASFWEGVDIPGDALQLVIIDKIPFLPPDDALTKARAGQMETAGKNAFRAFHLPHAALGLKQGAGRLIRTENDKGLLVVCDVRLTQKGYGKKLVSALPPMRRISEQAEFNAELAKITRLSTTDLCWL